MGHSFDPQDDSLIRHRGRYRAAKRNVRRAERGPTQFTSKLLRASVRLRRMSSTIDVTTRHHLMVGGASVCRLSALNRHPVTVPVTPSAPFNPRRGVVAERQNLIFARLRGHLVWV